MLYTVTVRPYGENETGDFIVDFDDDELEIIFDLFQSLGRKCVAAYDIIEKVIIEKEKDLIVINYEIKKGEDISEDDFLFYLESLTGHNSDNIITFGDEDYSIKGSPVLQKHHKKVTISPAQEQTFERESEDDADFMDKMMTMARDIAPELLDDDDEKF